MKKILFVILSIFLCASISAQEHSVKLEKVTGTGKTQRGKITCIVFIPDTVINGKVMYFKEIDSTFRYYKEKQIELKAEIIKQVTLVTDTTISTTEMIKRIKQLQYQVDLLQNASNEFNQWKTIRAERKKY
jgi:hypothetical protein